MAVCDSTARQIVRREFQGNLIAVHDLNSIAPESSSHRCQHRSTNIDLYRKHAGLEFLDDLAHYFDCVFFWQMFLTFPVLCELRDGLEVRRT